MAQFGGTGDPEVAGALDGTRVGVVGVPPEPALEQAASAPMPSRPRNPRLPTADGPSGVAGEGAVTGKTYADDGLDRR